MPDFSSILPLLSIIIAIGAAVGVVIAFLGNRNKGLSELDAKTISSLQATIASLEAQDKAREKQVAVLEKKVAQHERVLHTVQDMLRKRRRLRLEINDQYVTLIDERTGAEITVPIHTGPLEKIEKET
jgi:hypothetical protein